MIETVFKIAVLRLWNNKQELLLTFVVPIMFFTIFALIFTHGIGQTSAIKAVVVDDDRSSFSHDLYLHLQNESAIDLHDRIGRTNDTWPLDRLSREIVRQYDTNVVIYFPLGLEQQVTGGGGLPVKLLSEGSNPVERQIVSALLTQTIHVALAARTPATNTQTTNRPPQSSVVPATLTLPDSMASGKTIRGPVAIESKEIFAANKRSPKVAMYAAGIAVMFLLFSATGAGGSLLEEQEAGTLDRLLTSELTVTKLLAGKWLFITALGSVQLTVMFLWAQLAFGVDLMGHLPGFAVMTVCTAAATASLALCLATMCNTRNQLNGVSVVLILAMSALGGSMIPRYIMSEKMQRLGQLTFNAWALDGFKKIFWQDLPVREIADEVIILLVITVGLAIVARFFAERWTAR